MSLEVYIKKKLGNFNLDVNFVTENGTTSLLGASGCGKSMTLKCIAGIETPDKGRIVLDGVVLFDSEQKINLKPQKRHIGYLFQNYALFPQMDVFENVCAGASGTKQEIKAIAKEKIEAMHLHGLEHKYPHQLSGGQQQRVALARILASKPKMMMLDEPFSALDSYLKWQLEQELVDTLEDFGGISILVSHSREEVYRMSNKVCIIENGVSEPIVSVKEMFNNPKSMPAAMLSGCKNYSEATKIDNYRVYAKNWQAEFTTTHPVPDDVKFIGYRANNVVFTDKEEANTIDCKIIRITEDVFTMIYVLMPINSNNESDYEHIRVEHRKSTNEHFKIGQNLKLKLLPEDILVLK